MLKKPRAWRADWTGQEMKYLGDSKVATGFIVIHQD
jgi:hypothetical protein